MQPIILLAIVGIAGGAMGVGFLGNDISLDVQLLGVGETNLESPITHADIDFVIARQSGLIAGTTETHNVIAYCKITPMSQIDAGSHVFCKLTDENGFVAAEGITQLQKTVKGGETFKVAISAQDFAANKVQNIHDVVLVVQGP